MRYGNSAPESFHRYSSTLRCRASFRLLLDAAVDLITHQAGDGLTYVRVVQEFHNLIVVAVHTRKHQLFELAIEHMREVFEGIGFTCIADGLIGGGIGADLFPEKFVGAGEVGSESLVENRRLR